MSMQEDIFFERTKMLPDYFPKLMHETFREASIIAQHHGRDILMSLTVPISWCNILHIFAARRGYTETCFFWEHPATQYGLMGIGEATLIQVDKTARFQGVEDHWHALLRDAVIREVHHPQTKQTDISGPLLFGGKAFDAHSGHTLLWQDFSAGWLVLPYIMLSSYRGYTTLTINHLVQPGELYELKVADCIHFVKQLLAVRSIPYRKLLAIERRLVIQSDRSFLSPDEWKQAITRTVEYIQQSNCRKVVLARAVKVALHPPTETLDIRTMLSHLCLHYPTSYTFALKRGKRYFCGATPEQLARMQDGSLYTMALAGSLPRGANKAEDQEIETQLLQSQKHREEHTLVVTTILARLKQVCFESTYEVIPDVLKLSNVQHLITPIIGNILPGKSIFDVIMALHPTPAVGGIPYREALSVIRTEEKLDRGWYASPIGWLDARGNGEFAVALRCALLDEHSAVLFAGCGIVAGSKAEDEYQETIWKLQVMMDSLQEYL